MNTAKPSRNIVPVLSRDLRIQLRRMKSAVKLFLCISACLPEPVPVPFLPQRFLGGSTQECILTAGIIPGGRVFSCQGSAEEICLFLPLTPNNRHPRKAPGRNFLIFFDEKAETQAKKPGMHESISASYIPGVIHDR